MGVPSRAGYPVLFARASLKRRARRGQDRGPLGYPVLFARASLKPLAMGHSSNAASPLSRAFCAGLIEAARHMRRRGWVGVVIPCFLRGPH